MHGQPARGEQGANDRLPLRLLLPALLLVALLAACDQQSPSAKALSGTWELAGAEQEIWVGDQPSGQFRVIFSSDGKLITQTQLSGTKQGDWRVGSPNAVNDRLPAKVEIQGNLSGEAYQTTVNIIDENTIEMVPPNLVAIENDIEPMKFRRVEQ